MHLLFMKKILFPLLFFLPIYVQADLTEEQKWYLCEKDSDCTSVQGSSVCDCGHPINKIYRSEYSKFAKQEREKERKLYGEAGVSLMCEICIPPGQTTKIVCLNTKCSTQYVDEDV